MPRLTAPRRQAEVCAPLPAAHAAARYARHLPERTLLYALVEAHYPDFIARIEAEGRSLPGYVREAFDAYLRCGVLEHGFLRVVCEHCRAERLVAFSCKKRGFCPSCGARRMAESARHLVEEVFGPRPVRQWVLSFPYPLRFLFASKPEAIGPVLGIVQRVIAGWLADQAGIDRASAQCGAVTLIQRFGSALNLNIHFHMLWLDGVYVEATELPRRELRLHRARAPTTAQSTQLAATIAHRVCRHLTRKGWLEGEGESAFLADSAAGDDSMDGLRMSSITYRIATGRDAGCKVVTLQTLPGDAGSLEGEAGKVGGFSLHAGVAAEAHESHKLEKLCRYITRPAISEQRLSIALQGRVRYQLKTPWRNGTTHVEWDPVDFIAKLAALVPPPRAHLTRFHGVFAPNAALRAQLTPSGRGRRHDAAVEPADASANDAPRSPEEKRRSMSWAQRLKRVFSIDVTACVHCGGTVRIVASIEEPAAIRAILAHFEKHGALEQAHYRPAARAPPPAA
ncbi:IS91 family transposase [Pseudomonas aeruginosa]|nr:IS91 family transposase [Pseudomonas aeruginosa]